MKVTRFHHVSVNCNDTPVNEMVAFYTADLDRMRRHAEEWAAIARASGDDYELAMALLSLVPGWWSEAEPAIAIAHLEESIRVARDAGVFSALSISLPFLAGSLPVEESERKLALLDEAIEVGRLVGDRLGMQQVTMAKGAIALQRGEWRIALQMAREYVELEGAIPNAGIFAMAGFALCQLESFEAAAVLIGKSDALEARMGPEWVQELSSTTAAALLAALGAQPVTALAARGAAPDITDASEYVRAQARLVLDAE